MIIKEQVDGFIKTYSSKGVYIHGGVPEGDYTEAMDLVDREYTETDIPIEAPTEPEELLQAAEAALTEGVNSIG